MDNSVEGLIHYIEKSVTDFESGMSEWIEEAWNSFDFIAGRQYTQVEVDQLKSRLRPVVIFNLLEKFVSSISGTEIANEMNVRYYPNAVSRSGPVEVVQEVINTLLDEGNDVEHSEAFCDALVAGYGWLECYLSQEDGYYCFKEVRVDPFEMGWDPNAKKRNLIDASFIYNRKYMDREAVEAEWPDKIEELKLAQTGTAATRYVQLDTSTDYRGIGVRDFRDQYAVIHFQRRRFVRYLKINAGGKDQEIPEADFDKVKKQFEEMGNVVEKKGVSVRHVYSQCYYCRGILLEDEQDINGFSYFCVTGKRDLVKNYFYGVLRNCMDPQRWTNKFFSNLMHTMSTSGQGVFLERSAVAPKDAQNFESDYARPDKIKWLADGAISGNKFKVADQTPMPAGLPQLLDFATNAINNTLGINLEFLGMAGRTQSGPVESSRKRAGLNILAQFFQSKRLQIRLLGKRRLDYLQHYVPKEFVLGVLSDLNKPYYEATQEIYFEPYFVRVDEAPNSADVKTDVWTIIIELIPYLMNVKLPPQFLVTLLKYSPLPTHIVDELFKIVNAPPSPEEEKAKALQLEQLEGDVAESKSKALLNVAKAKTEGTNPDAIGEVINRLLEIQKADQEAKHAKEEHQLKMAELQAKHRVDQAKAGISLAHDQVKSQVGIESAKAKADTQLQIMKQKVSQDNGSGKDRRK